MTLTYLYHSGFVVETADSAVVIDFWRDPAGVMPRLLKGGKRLYVVASHFHEDHFNPEVLTWRETHADTLYILSKDILRHRRAPREAATAWIAKGQAYADDRINVRAFGSTDSGVSLLFGIGGRRLFHAGDLNNWHWSDESSAEEAARAEAMYLGELKDIAKMTTAADVVMFPVDARIGTGYMRGAAQFVERISTGLFVPMHFTACGRDTASAFALTAEAAGARFWTPGHEGDSIEIFED